MVQTGDPTGTGRGGTSIYGQKLYVTTLRNNFRLSDLIPTVRTKYTQIYGLLALVFLPWRTQDRIQMV